jgi:hypothetical protein
MVNFGSESRGWNLFWGDMCILFPPVGRPDERMTKRSIIQLAVRLSFKCRKRHDEPNPVDFGLSNIEAGGKTQRK